jgi:hypothetical protein
MAPKGKGGKGKKKSSKKVVWVKPPIEHTLLVGATYTMPMEGGGGKAEKKGKKAKGKKGGKKKGKAEPMLQAHDLEITVASAVAASIAPGVNIRLNDEIMRVEQVLCVCVCVCVCLRRLHQRSEHQAE